MPAAKVSTKRVPPAQGPELRLPHERDQSSVDTTAAAPDPVIVQAAKDLQDGQVDTDMRSSDGLDGPLRRRMVKGKR